MRDALSTLTDGLDPKTWSADPTELDPWLTDWRGRYRGESPLLLKPSTTAEVAEIVARCHSAGIAITPQGGNTGLVGGATPQGEVLLSLRRMNRIREVDPANDSLIAEAGAILETVQNEAAAAGRLFPLSLAAQGSATLGGLVSTNAGGVHVVRYGMMRDLVLGLEAVLPDGCVISDLSGLRKDNTGYDLKQLFIGAEGTLGIVTAASLKLHPRPASTAVAIAAVKDPQGAVDLLSAMKAGTGGAIAAFELMPHHALAMAASHLPDGRLPLEGAPPWTVLIELVSGEADRAGTLLEAELAKAFERGLAQDAVLAQNAAQAAAFWALREAIPEAERAHGLAAKHDVSVPVSRMPAFMEEATEKAEALIAGSKMIAFGHVGDGNVHFNLARAEPGAGPEFLDAARPATALIYDLVDKYGGSISAEHGIGILKHAELARRKPVEVSVMAAIKQALDPKGIMNPRVLIGG